MVNFCVTPLVKGQFIVGAYPIENKRENDNEGQKILLIRNDRLELYLFDWNNIYDLIETDPLYRKISGATVLHHPESDVILIFLLISPMKVIIRQLWEGKFYHISDYNFQVQNYLNDDRPLLNCVTSTEYVYEGRNVIYLINTIIHNSSYVRCFSLQLSKNSSDGKLLTSNDINLNSLVCGELQLLTWSLLHQNDEEGSYHLVNGSRALVYHDDITTGSEHVLSYGRMKILPLTKTWHGTTLHMYGIICGWTVDSMILFTIFGNDFNSKIQIKLPFLKSVDIVSKLKRFETYHSIFGITNAGFVFEYQFSEKHETIELYSHGQLPKVTPNYIKCLSENHIFIGMATTKHLIIKRCETNKCLWRFHLKEYIEEVEEEEKRFHKDIKFNDNYLKMKANRQKLNNSIKCSHTYYSSKTTNLYDYSSLENFNKKKVYVIQSFPFIGTIDDIITDDNLPILEEHFTRISKSYASIFEVNENSSNYNLLFDEKYHNELIEEIQLINTYDQLKPFRKSPHIDMDDNNSMKKFKFKTNVHDNWYVLSSSMSHVSRPYRLKQQKYYEKLCDAKDFLRKDDKILSMKLIDTCYSKIGDGENPFILTLILSLISSNQKISTKIVNFDNNGEIDEVKREGYKKLLKEIKWKMCIFCEKIGNDSHLFVVDDEGVLYLMIDGIKLIKHKFNERIIIVKKMRKDRFLICADLKITILSLSNCQFDFIWEKTFNQSILSASVRMINENEHFSLVLFPHIIHFYAVVNEDDDIVDDNENDVREDEHVNENSILLEIINLIDNVKENEDESNHSEQLNENNGNLMELDENYEEIKKEEFIVELVKMYNPDSLCEFPLIIKEIEWVFDDVIFMLCDNRMVFYLKIYFDNDNKSMIYFDHESMKEMCNIVRLKAKNDEILFFDKQSVYSLTADRKSVKCTLYAIDLLEFIPNSSKFIASNNNHLFIGTTQYKVKLCIDELLKTRFYHTLTYFGKEEKESIIALTSFDMIRNDDSLSDENEYIGRCTFVSSETGKTKFTYKLPRNHVPAHIRGWIIDRKYYMVINIQEDGSHLSHIRSPKSRLTLIEATPPFASHEAKFDTLTEIPFDNGIILLHNLADAIIVLESNRITLVAFESKSLVKKSSHRLGNIKVTCCCSYNDELIAVGGILLAITLLSRNDENELVILKKVKLMDYCQAMEFINKENIMITDTNGNVFIWNITSNTMMGRIHLGSVITKLKRFKCNTEENGDYVLLYGTESGEIGYLTSISSDEMITLTFIQQFIEANIPINKPMYHYRKYMKGQTIRIENKHDNDITFDGECKMGEHTVSPFDVVFDNQVVNHRSFIHINYLYNIWNRLNEKKKEEIAEILSKSYNPYRTVKMINDRLLSLTNLN
ncbi:hypothetical protein SNEBB_002817 [Seison nebaliae]|nr:hypothetical protein SNEBB_002817 [Seison nebaliae]